MGTRSWAAPTVPWLGAALRAGEASRSGLARELCRREGWHHARGRLGEASARQVLPAWAEAWGTRLPAARPGPPPGVPGELPETPCTGPLAQLQPVETRAQRRVWRRLREAHHPCGAARAPGQRLASLVESRPGLLRGGAAAPRAARRAPRLERTGAPGALGRSDVLGHKAEHGGELETGPSSR